MAFAKFVFYNAWSLHQPHILGSLGCVGRELHMVPPPAGILAKIPYFPFDDYRDRNHHFSVLGGMA